MKEERVSSGTQRVRLRARAELVRWNVPKDRATDGGTDPGVEDSPEEPGENDEPPADSDTPPVDGSSEDSGPDDGEDSATDEEKSEEASPEENGDDAPKSD